jgi:beta-N-acetylhexosaminidase
MVSLVPASRVPSTTSPSTISPPNTSADPASTTSPTTGPTAPQCLAAWSDRALVGQLVWPAVYGDELGARAADFADWGVGGAVLMNWTAESSAAQLQALKSAGPVPLLVATDEEGGDVQRMEAFGEIPAAADVPATMNPNQATAMITRHAVTLHTLGIDMVFAPVVDVLPPGGGGPIGRRSFGSDPEVVAEYAAAYVRGWTAAGVTPVLKHFPGHGAATGDTHDGFAVVAPLDELRVRDLVPYAELNGLGADVMVGHLSVPGLTDADAVPASLSPSAYTLLRAEYAENSTLLITDALGMNAISDRFSLPEAATQSIRAGADVVIFTDTDATADVLDRLVAAVSDGSLPRQRVADAAKRVLDRKRVDPCVTNA